MPRVSRGYLNAVFLRGGPFCPLWEPSKHLHRNGDVGPPHLHYTVHPAPATGQPPPWVRYLHPCVLGRQEVEQGGNKLHQCVPPSRVLLSESLWDQNHFYNNSKRYSLPGVQWTKYWACVISIFKCWRFWEFPGGPVVKTPCFHRKGCKSIPGWGTKIPRHN